jgi:hypothetical protein
MIIELKGKPLDFADEPLCTLDQVGKARAIVERNMPALYDQLPDGHMWKSGKPAHMQLADDFFGGIFSELRASLCAENFELLRFIYLCHDLGRAHEVLYKLDRLPEAFQPFKNHADASVRIMRSWGALEPFSAVTYQVIVTAIRHHVDSKSPDVPNTNFPIILAQHLFMCLLRDLDKYANFLQRTDLYLNDATKKRHECEQHGFVGEMGAIVPVAFLDDFRSRRTPSLKWALQNGAVSYEAYMLYFLSWIFDVNLSIVQQEIVASGAVQQLLGYFCKQLPDTQHAIISKVMEAYLDDVE